MKCHQKKLSPENLNFANEDIFPTLTTKCYLVANVTFILSPEIVDISF